MSMWQVDFSKSRYFKHVGDDNVQVRKPNFTKRQIDGQAVWLGVAIDDASRVMYVSYFVTSGEHSLTVQSFLVSAFQEKQNQKLLQGLPTSIYVDRGSAWLTKMTDNGLEKLGVAKIVGSDEKDVRGNTIRRSNKKARGKVERQIRTLKEKMEQALFLKLEAGRQISLVSLNLIVEAWVQQWNQRKHPTREGEYKWEIFAPALTELTYPPEDALAFFHKVTLKTVVRGKINVGDGLICDAPEHLDDGHKVEIIQDNSGHYLFAGGKRTKLTYQSGTTTAKLKKAKIRVKEMESRNLKSETREDTFEDYELRSRFCEELGRYLSNLPDRICSQLEPFFSSKRTLAEIRDKVKWTREEMQRVAFSDSLPPNVIVSSEFGRL